MSDGLTLSVLLCVFFSDVVLQVNVVRLALGRAAEICRNYIRTLQKYLVSERFKLYLLFYRLE